MLSIWLITGFTVYTCSLTVYVTFMVLFSYISFMLTCVWIFITALAAEFEAFVSSKAHLFTDVAHGIPN